MRQLVIVSLDKIDERVEINLGDHKQAVSSEPCFALDHLNVLDSSPTQQGQIFIPTSPDPIPFSNAKTLLGREFPYAIYDMRADNGICLNLEALAIVAGTIQSGGKLYLLCPQWKTLPQLPDRDSLRWNNNQLIATPNFYCYFKQLITEFGFEVVSHREQWFKNRYNVPIISVQTRSNEILTSEQQIILQKIPLADADIHLITAPRGRGKSTLLGKLAESLAKTHSVLLTARSHSALTNVWQSIHAEKVDFIAPDKLVAQIESKQIWAKQWLLVDEAASLPLPMLHKFCHYFDKIVLTSTTHNYEGTGRGFSLKFPAQIERPIQHWQLTKPLRYAENDPLERFIQQLLLLEDNVEVTGGQFSAEISQKIALYQLLAQAHYKTTPTDLRRLFDAPQQFFYQIGEHQKLIAGSWAMAEGGLDDSLTQAIWRGERRPAGNLVAQYLCFQGTLPQACQLRSIRISRLAVHPAFQRKGYGKRLVSDIISQIQAPIDFISVSFGMSQPLLKFWQQCGFQLVQITPNLEASSGYRSAMMIYPLSEQGQQFTEQALLQFERDLPLQPFYTELPTHLQKNHSILPLDTLKLSPQDWQNLAGFAYHQRSFSSCYVSLKRLYFAYPEQFSELNIYFHTAQPKISPNKMEINQLRVKLQNNPLIIP